MKYHEIFKNLCEKSTKMGYIVYCAIIYVAVTPSNSIFFVVEGYIYAKHIKKIYPGSARPPENIYLKKFHDIYTN